jgi:phospholipid-translocating ATPase
MEKVISCPAVVCCRCSPEQKADIVKLIEAFTKKSAAAIGEATDI